MGPASAFVRSPAPQPGDPRSPPFSDLLPSVRPVPRLLSLQNKHRTPTCLPPSVSVGNRHPELGVPFPTQGFVVTPLILGCHKASPKRPLAFIPPFAALPTLPQRTCGHLFELFHGLAFLFSHRFIYPVTSCSLALILLHRLSLLTTCGFLKTPCLGAHLAVRAALMVGRWPAGRGPLLCGPRMFCALSTCRRYVSVGHLRGTGGFGCL